MKPTFDRLSDDKLLKRCLSGFTQNQNESINSVLWSRCPKSKFCGVVKVKLAVAETVCQFNTGMDTFVSLHKAMETNVSKTAINTLRKLDKIRVQNAARKILANARLTRRKARAKKHISQATKKQSYVPGGFGTNKVPEGNVNLKCSLKVKQKDDKTVKLVFTDENSVIMNFKVVVFGTLPVVY